MIALPKLLIGAGALGAAGLSAWAIYHVSAPKTIQDKLSRDGLRILNLNKDNNADEAIWKAKIKSHKEISEEETQTNLKINSLSFSSDVDPNAEDIKKFKEKCSELLITSLGTENSDLKEQQARKWCVEDPKSE